MVGDRGHGLVTRSSVLIWEVGRERRASTLLALARPPAVIRMQAVHFLFFARLCIWHIRRYDLSFWATLTTEPTAAIEAIAKVAHSSISLRLFGEVLER